MKLFVTIHADARLLGHFVRHYRARGVTQFFVAVPPQLLHDARRLARGHPVNLIEGLDVADSVSGTAAVTEMRARHQCADEWVVIVDLDEFLEVPALTDVIAAADRAGANVVRGIMHDRFSLDGRPRGFSETDSLPEVYPIKSRFIRDVMGGFDHKGALVKGLLRPAPGAAHHWFIDERGFSEVLEISHYKWTDSSVDRVRAAYDIVSAAGIRWADEYARVLDHYERHGRFAWETFGGRPWREFRPEPPAGHCADCGAAISEAERAYSQSCFNAPLCRGHQVDRDLTKRP